MSDQDQDQDQDQDFQQRWGFRRNESDSDSSSDDHSRPGSASEPKLKKHKLVRNLVLEENDQEANDSPQLDPGAETHLSNEETNKEPKRSRKKQNPNRKGIQKQRKFRAKEPKKMASESHEPSDPAFNDLGGYTVSLIEGIKVAREDLLKWMSKEMEKSSANGMISSKPNGKGKARSSKPARTNTNKGQGQKPNGGSSEKSVRGKKTSHPTNDGVVEPQKEPDNVPPAITTPLASPEKPKRKRLGASEKKQKTAVAEQQTCKATAAAPTPEYLTLPTVLPRPQVENSDRTRSEDGNDNEAGKRNTMNAASSLSSQLTGFSRTQQKDGNFGQNGMRKLVDYEQNIVPNFGNIRGNGNGNGNGSGYGNGNGNGNGNGFPFPLAQGLNGGMGIPNSNHQLGMQFLSQENRLSSGLRMNGGPTTRFPSANHAFMQNYGGVLDQHLRFKAQTGVMGLHCPDIRGPNLQPR